MQFFFLLFFFFKEKQLSCSVLLDQITRDPGGLDSLSVVSFDSCLYEVSARFERCNTKRYKKKTLYLSVNVFSTKALIGDTIFTFPTGNGTAILRGHPSHAKV